MLSVILASILTFIATEVDDFAVYVVLFAQKKDHKFSIFMGQLTVVFLLAVLCAFVSIPLSKIPAQYLRFIGIIPIGLGIWSIFEKEEEHNFKTTSLFLTSALLTLAASADNLGIYIPFFTSLSILEKSVSIGIFVILQSLWSFLQIKTADLPFVQKFVEKTSRFLVPVIFILLGILIILDLL